MSGVDNPKKRLLNQASTDELQASSSSSVLPASSSIEPESAAKKARASVVVNEARTERKVEHAAEQMPLPTRQHAFNNPRELLQYTAAYQNKALLKLVHAARAQLSEMEQRWRTAQSKAECAEQESASVHAEWAKLIADLRVVAVRLGTDGVDLSRRSAVQTVQSVSAFRRLLYSHIKDDSSASGAAGGGGGGADDGKREGDADLHAYLLRRKSEASQLLVSVVDAIQRGGKLTDSSALVDELQAHLSSERDRSTALADKLARAELRLSEATTQVALLRDDLDQAVSQRERARTALRSYQAATLAASTAASAAGGTAAEAAAAAQIAAEAAQASISNQEVEDLRASLESAERKAADRLSEIEKLRHLNQVLDEERQKERVDLCAPMPEHVYERSELFAKLRQKQEQTEALHAEKRAEAERLQKALADAEQLRVADLARVEQQNRAALDDVVEKLRESENTLQRVRGERRAVTLKVAELEAELQKSKEDKAAKDKYVGTLSSYTRAIATRAVLPRLRADVAGVADTVNAATAATLSNAAAGVDAATATTTALDQVIAASQLAALQSELSDLRAKAVLWLAQQTTPPTADEQRVALARQLAEAQASLASAEETHRVLEGELDSLCKAVDESAAELRDSVALISAKDDVNLQLMTDKAKLRTAIQSSKEATLIKQAQLEKLEAVLNKQKASFDAKVEELRHATELLEQRRLLIIELEAARDAANAVEKRRVGEDAVAKARLEATAKQVAEAQQTIQANVAAIHELTGKLARQKEEANMFKRNWEAARNLNNGGNDEQVAFWREKSICKVCLEREKTTVLSKCWHTFCGDCIEQNLRDRHRKCPKCGAKFGEQDVHILF
jgi:E3 ubiquitin-protein ligase BRE1